MKIHIAEFAPIKGADADFLNELRKSIEDAYIEVIQLLPFTSQYVNFYVHPSEYIIKETGLNGYTVNSEYISISFDSELRLGSTKILQNIRPIIFHEMNHAARFQCSIWHETSLDMCLFEGLATVFEREHAGINPPWGQYNNADVQEWLAELRTLKNGVLTDEYRFEHPDGRRWIAYKVGTYIIDEAIKHSGMSVIELTQKESKEILELAKI